MNNLPAHLSTLIDTLETAQANTPKTESGDFQFLKMGKDGIWIYGADDTEVGSDSFFVIEPASYAQGYIAWDDGDLVDERMAVAGGTPVLLTDLPSVRGEGWTPQIGFALLGLEGKEEGVQMMFKSSSKGGRECISELLGKIIERGRNGEADLCPVVKLGNAHYTHKKYGKIYTPVLEVDEWMDAPEAGEEPAEEPAAVIEPPTVVEEEEPKKRVRRSRK